MPVIIINDQIVVGFNQARIDELLAKESLGKVIPVVAEPTLPAVQTPPADIKPPEV